jgi:peptide/nickel transport system permease protein
MATRSIDMPLESPLPERATGIGTWPAAIAKFARRKPLGAVGAFIILLMVIAALFVDARLFGSDEPLLALTHYNDQEFGAENQGISWDHPMGTDRLGRDMYSRILYGARVSMVVGLITVALVGLISVVMGTPSGFWGGWFDTILQRLVDVLLAIPVLILILFGLSVFAPDSGPYPTMAWIIVFLVIVITAANIRVVRSAAISASTNQYVDAARALGATDMRVMARHIVPNVIPVVIVLATLQLGAVILAEASISFLGYGVRDPFPSWGAMLNRNATADFRAFPLQAVWPGLAIALAVYAFNMFGDALRDVLDPRLRGGR